MPRIPERNFNVSELEEKKIYVVTYKYHTNDGWFVDTWHIESTNMGTALSDADYWCESQLGGNDSLDTYKIIMIMECDAV